MVHHTSLLEKNLADFSRMNPTGNTVVYLLGWIMVMIAKVNLVCGLRKIAMYSFPVHTFILEHTHTHIHTLALTFTRTHTQTHTHAHSHTHTHMHTFTHTHTHRRGI